MGVVVPNAGRDARVPALAWSRYSVTADIILHMRMLLGAMILMLMGAASIRLGRSPKYLKPAARVAQTEHAAALAARTAGIVLLILALVCLLT
ncbi:MAG: hypothetical protein ABJA02_06595, partial [Acidobacteriota bacterium]